MRSTTLSLLAALGLIVAACGVEGSTTTTTEPAPVPEAVVLSYDLEPGTSINYEVTLDQHIDMTTTGDSAALAAEDVPGEASIDVTGTTTVGFSVADGPEPGTYAVTVTGDFSNLTVDGTLDGEPIDPSEIPDFAEIPPIEETIIVDEQGNVIPQEGEDMGEFGDLFGDLGGLGGLGSFGSELGQFVGPHFSDREVTVGDTWSDTNETPLFGDQVLTTTVDNEVTGTDEVDGHEVFVIESTTTMSPVEIDLAEILIGFFQAFIPEDATEEELAELEQLTSQLRFLFAMDATSSEMTTWFDAESGQARKAEVEGGADISLDANFPDDETGEMTAFAVTVSMQQSVSYHLLPAE
jgi:hypothetical protein